MKHDDPRLTEYALGEMDGPGRASERAEVEAALAADAGLRAEVEAIRDSAGVLRGGLAAEAVPALDAAHRGVLEEAMGLPPERPAGLSRSEATGLSRNPTLGVARFGDSPLRGQPPAGLGALAATLLLAIGFTIAGATGGVEFGARPDRSVIDLHVVSGDLDNLKAAGNPVSPPMEFSEFAVRDIGKPRGGLMPSTNHEIYAIGKRGMGLGPRANPGLKPQRLRLGVKLTLNSSLEPASAVLGQQVFALDDVTNGFNDEVSGTVAGVFTAAGGDGTLGDFAPADSSTESFGTIVENAWIRPVGEAALSTFSIDVDTAAYSIVRRFLAEQNRLPSPGALRIEELVNYFPYAYAPPAGADPFAVHVDAATCPWNARHRLVRIALKGREVEEAQRPAANIVLLVDVSGSMAPQNKLPLVKKSIAMLAERLTARDRVAMVVYAGSSGLVLPSTTGDRRAEIHLAIDRLSSGGSTNGGAGIQLAYKVAAENFVPGGINRVVLATDGDFNVGISDPSALVKLVEEKAKTGVFLTALGYGMDNLKDSTLEQLADKGNGNYGYIDTVREAEKVLVTEGMSTLHAIAKDVKIQVEFNPARVAGYRLLGYENRVLAAQDFADDAKDAGEIGAGHCVTALYEVVPAGETVPGAKVDDLRYQRPAEGSGSIETLTVKLRWKEPEGTTSTLREVPFSDDGRAFDAASADFRFAASVAAFGMVLRDSAHKGDAGLPMVREIAAGALGDDRGGYRAEFLTLVDRAAAIK